MPVTWMKKKYCPGGGGDYWAKKNGANGDHGRRKKRNKTGLKTYNPANHVLVVLKSGKKRMVHK